MHSFAGVSHIYFSQRLRLHYMEWPHKDAAVPNMVLVHGMQDHCRTWDALATQFSSDYRIIAPDLRGHGDSEWVKGAGYHYLDYVYDLHQLIEQAELAPALRLFPFWTRSLRKLHPATSPHYKLSRSPRR